MPDRDELIHTFLSNAGWASARREVIAGDASNRRYERLYKGTATVILMDAPPNKGEEVKPFVQIARYLISIGLSAPTILEIDQTHGFLLIEDLGDALFARLLDTEPGLEQQLYAASVDVLVHAHRFDPPDLARYDAARMTDLAVLAFDWYQTGILGESTGRTEFAETFLNVLKEVDEDPPVLIQRDYHAENLLWLPTREGIARVGLLDFQDAMLGHRAYDLVSILQDARRDVSSGVESEMIDRYVSMSDQDPIPFHRAYLILSVQRNLRILGVFARLCLAYGKARYIDLIPRVWNHLMRTLAHEELAPLRAKLAVLPAPTESNLEKLKVQCGTRPLH